MLHHRGYRDDAGNLFVKDVWGGFLDDLADRLGARFTLYTSRDRHPRQRFQHFNVAGSRHLTLKCPTQPPPGVALVPFLADLPRLDAALVFLPTLRGLGAVVACRALRVPVFVYSGTGGNAYAGAERAVALRGRAYARLEGLALRGARGAVVAGPELEAGFRARMPTYRTAPITGMTDEPRTVVEKRREVLYVGSLSAHKGVPELLEAWRRLDEDERAGWRLRLVGSGPLEDDVRRFARDRRDCDVLGYIPHGPALYSVYAQAGILVLPSHNEGFPRVLVEAAAHRCALVATPVGGVPDAFADRYRPEWIRAGDPRSLADGLSRMMRRDWQACGADALEWFEATFSGRDRVGAIADFIRAHAPRPVGVHDACRRVSGDVPHAGGGGPRSRRSGAPATTRSAAAHLRRRLRSGGGSTGR